MVALILDRVSRRARGQGRRAKALRRAGCGVVAAGLWAGLGVAQTAIPDAQIESSLLKALAGVPELANQQITMRTTNGIVTLSGAVSTEQARDQAEQLAAKTTGVVKVVDELRLEGSSPVTASSSQGVSPLVLLSDGTYGPAPVGDGQPVAPQAAAQVGAAGAPMDAAGVTAPQRNDPEADQQLDLEMEQRQNAANGQTGAPGVQPNGQAAPGQGLGQGGSQYPNSAQGQYPGQAQGQYPAQYPNQAGGAPYPNQPGVGQYSNGQYPSDQSQAGGSQAPPPTGYPYPRRPMYYPGYQQQPYPPAYGGYVPQGGQVAGQQVVVPSGALLRVRINRMLRSDQAQPGTTFDGIVVNDVTAGGLIAIPRGAAVQGTVVDAKGSGALTGRGEMSIKLTSVSLSGRNYPLVTDLWAHNGGDKTIETVNKTAGFGAVGAVIGALAGGGVGAAVGGGVGAAAGLGSSAVSGHGQVVLPPEAVVTFHTAQPTTVATVSQQEMQRLAYGVPPGADGRPAPRAYPPVYLAPGYYPGYYPYRPYGPYGY